VGFVLSVALLWAETLKLNSPYLQTSFRMSSHRRLS
jgi:hypothetical protein